MRRLDALTSVEEAKKYDHWVVDVQGAELLVLKVTGDLLSYCKWLNVEVNLRETNAGAAPYESLCSYLSQYQFFPLWNPPEGFHGDVIFIGLS